MNVIMTHNATPFAPRILMRLCGESEANMTGLEMSQQMIAERESLYNPIRRHDADGFVEAQEAPDTPQEVKRVSVLTEAQGLIHGDRNSAYGHPLDNHTATARLMSAYLQRKYGAFLPLDAEDVCLFNVLQKVARLANTPGHRDSLVDIGGYVGCVEMIQDERARRG